QSDAAGPIAPSRAATRAPAATTTFANPSRHPAPISPRIVRSPRDPAATGPELMPGDFRRTLLAGRWGHPPSGPSSSPDPHKREIRSVSATEMRPSRGSGHEGLRLVGGVMAEDQEAADLLPLVYDELRALAARYLRNERPGVTLQPTVLVHEAYL